MKSRLDVVVNKVKQPLIVTDIYGVGYMSPVDLNLGDRMRTEWRQRFRSIRAGITLLMQENGQRVHKLF